MDEHVEIVGFFPVGPDGKANTNAPPDPRFGVWRADGKPLTWQQMLDQGEWWRTRAGDWVRVAELGHDHASNLRFWLENRATALQFRYCMQLLPMAPTATHAGDAFDDMLDEIMSTDPIVWLRTTKLLTAIGARLDAIHAAEYLEVPPTIED